LASDFVRIGRIVGSFGIKGQVKVAVETDFDQRFKPGSRVRLEQDWVEIKASSWHKGQLILKIVGVDDRTHADSLQWKSLSIPIDQRPKLDENQFFADDLIGMQVITDTGKALGTVDDVLAYPAQDLLQVGSVLIPMVHEFILDIDPEAKVIKIAPIEGLLEQDR
jgi:16S rRNA processing protein RimM